LIFQEVTDKNKLAPFFMAHGVVVVNNSLWSWKFAPKDAPDLICLYWQQPVR